MSNRAFDRRSRGATGSRGPRAQAGASPPGATDTRRGCEPAEHPHASPGAVCVHASNDHHQQHHAGDYSSRCCGSRRCCCAAGGPIYAGRCSGNMQWVSAHIDQGCKDFPCTHRHFSTHPPDVCSRFGCTHQPSFITGLPTRYPRLSNKTPCVYTHWVGALVKACQKR